MSLRTISIDELNDRIEEHVREVGRGGRLLITRDGKPVAALVPAAEYERLEPARSVDPATGLADLAGGWNGSEELVRILDESPRLGRAP